ncbi:16303_t:CDS:2, partial [Racocetra persica]
MNRGYWLDDGENLKNPVLRFAHAANHIQEELIEKVEIIEEDRKVASCSGYVGSPGIYTPNQDTDIEFVLDKSDKSNRQVASCKAG